MLSAPESNSHAALAEALPNSIPLGSGLIFSLLLKGLLYNYSISVELASEQSRNTDNLPNARRRERADDKVGS